MRGALLVLRCALDRRYPALAPLHPDLVDGHQLEARLIQTSHPNPDERAAGVGSVNQPRPTAGAEAATVIARDLAAHLERLDGPMRIHTERTAGLLSAVCAVATPDVHGVTANAVADRPAETSAGAYRSHHAHRCYGMASGADDSVGRRREREHGGERVALQSHRRPAVAAVAALPELPVGEAGEQATVGGEERVRHRRQRLRQPARQRLPGFAVVP